MDSLLFYADNNNTALTALALGTVAPSTSDDVSMRLFNSNRIYQAEDVSITVTGDDAIELWLSADGDTFGSTLAIGDLPPNAFSTVFYLRRVTASTSTGARTAQLTATPTAWTNPADSAPSGNVALDTED